MENLVLILYIFQVKCVIKGLVLCNVQNTLTFNTHIKLGIAKQCNIAQHQIF